jgi:hypothetical protein
MRMCLRWPVSCLINDKSMFNSVVFHSMAWVIAGTFVCSAANTTHNVHKAHQCFSITHGHLVVSSYSYCVTSLLRSYVG